ncbi:hypothetical protein EJB05_08576, partial [Eragrostis curvula]
MRRHSHISRRQARDAAGRFFRKVERGPRVVDSPAVAVPVESEAGVKTEVERAPRVVIAVDSDSDDDPVVPTVRAAPESTHTTKNKHGASSSDHKLKVTKMKSKVGRMYVVHFDKVEIKCTFTDESDDENPGHFYMSKSDSLENY